MKVIIAGSRGIESYDEVKLAILESRFVITEVVSGGANGVDKLGEQWAQETGTPVKQFLPEWKVFGRRAGPLRNTEMAEYADGAIILWDGKSKGTKDMLDKIIKSGKWVFAKLVTPNDETDKKNTQD